jgi:hypothetical protein
MRNLTVADGRRDAPCHRMKRLESWRVFIDAEHMASDLGIRPSRCLCILPTFPDFGNSFATIGISFTQGDWSAHAAIAILRSSSLLKNLEMESFLIQIGRCWSGAVELDVIF